MDVDETVRTAPATGVDDSDPRTLGRRCTAHLEAGRYPDALNDAKALVRLLPDAPIGYLKAARCYRLLKKLKASARMLDAATERAADESTLKAVRTEMRKLQQDEQAQQEARNRPFADSLPEEIFIEIMSYLSQSERVRAAQVSKTWRMVLHSHTTLWTTMYLNVNGHGSSKQQSERLRAQIAFYEARLPKKSRRNDVHLNASSRGANALECLSIHGVKLIEDTSNDLRRFVGSVSLPAHRLVRSLAAISLSNASPHTCEWLYSRFEGVKTLRSVRIACPHATRSVAEAWLDGYLAKGEAIEIRRDTSSAQFDPGWPYLSPHARRQHFTLSQSPRRNNKGIMVPDLRHLRVQSGVCMVLPSSNETVEATHPDAPILLSARAADHLRTLHIGNSSNGDLSLLFLQAAPKQLRKLSLEHAFLAFLDPKLSKTDVASMGTSELVSAASSSGISTMEFPELVEFHLPASEGTRIAGARLPPSTYMSRVRAPKLCTLRIENAGTLHGSRVPGELESNAWRTFCSISSCLRELVLHKTSVPDQELLASIPLLSKLEKLTYTHVKLPNKFLELANSPNLPCLQYLSIAHCTNIASGDALRLVQSKNSLAVQSSSSKNGQLSYLDIEGCTELHKEAVDWLKANVKTVVWKGWKDPKEAKAFNFNR